jgi:hypothetical protein
LDYFCGFADLEHAFVTAVGGLELSLHWRFPLALISLVAIAPAAFAQGTVTVDTLTSAEFPERTSWENGFLSRFAMDRVPLGGRATGMGGAGLAILSGPEYQALNPAAILGVRRPELEAEGKIFSGSAGSVRVPDELDLGGGQSLRANNYRTQPRQSFSHNSLSFGLPVMLLGNRGVLAATYRRVASTGSADETRVELRGPLTNEADATYGFGDLPEDGMDAVTVGVAREITDFFDLGLGLNWQSGTLVRDTDIGVAVFGFEILNAFSEFSQDVSSFNVDLGGRLEIGRFDFGGAVYLGHDLDFTNANVRIKPVPDPQNPSVEFLVLSQPLDHSISVPLMYGLGAAVEPVERLTVAADFYARPWTKAEITRDDQVPVIGFLDPFIGDSDTTISPGDPGSYFFQLNTPEDPEGNKLKETFSAGLDNTHSFRVGLEYLLVQDEGFTLPIRFGFRTENFTMNNIVIPDFQGLEHLVIDPVTGDTTGVTRSVDYLELIEDYFEALKEAAMGNQSPYLAEIEGQLESIAERNHMDFQGEPISTTAFTFGVGVTIDNFGADLTFERVSYDTDRFFLQDFDPLLNPIPAMVEERRNLINVSFATRMQF